MGARVGGLIKEIFTIEAATRKKARGKEEVLPQISAKGRRSKLVRSDMKKALGN
jgi:hypothetical protein